VIGLDRGVTPPGEPPARQQSPRFAMGVSTQLDRLDEVASLIEAVGFDAIGCGDHVVFHGPVPSAFVVLARLSAVIHRARLLAAVALAPLYPAGLLAKQATILDVLSDGRLDLGIGIGGEFPAEFEACGVPRAERGARTDETLALLRHIWSGQPSRFDGRWSTFEPRALQPPPIQPYGPPIWIGGRTEPAMRRAGRFADVWMPYLMTPKMFARSIVRVRGLAEMAGRDPHAVSSHPHCYISVASDGNRARRAAAEVVGGMYGQDFTGRRAQYLVAGTADECIDQLAAYLDAGADGFVFALAVEPRDEIDAIETLGGSVLPALRARGEVSSDR
jgi:probable F420-dependent oxidoreductase